MTHELRNVAGNLATSTLELNQAGADSLGLVGGGQTAWHKLGVALREGMSAVEAGEALKMFWPVESWDIYTMSPAAKSAFEQLLKGIASQAPHNCLLDLFDSYVEKQVKIDSYKANVRSDSQTVLGVVSDGYSVCQNRELAEFADALAQTGQVTIETAGTISGGKKLWFLARGEAFNIGGSDKVYPYLLVSNSHDGTQAVRVTPTSCRVVCKNTLHMVIPNSEDMLARPDNAAIVIRHSGQISDKLEKAKEALRHYQTIVSRNEILFNRLNDAQISEDVAVDLFGTMYSRWYQVADAEMLTSTDSKLARTAELRIKRMETGRDLFLNRWKEERIKLGQEKTVWGALNALTGYIAHDKRPDREQDTKTYDSLFGQDQNKSQEALAEAMAIVAV